MATKKITEKKTGEKYASKKAMMKHEKGESKAEMKKEYGKPKAPLKQTMGAVGMGAGTKEGKYMTKKVGEAAKAYVKFSKDLEFIKAELALNGFTTGKTVKAHYESGISGSIVQWGATVPAGFLLKKGVALDETASKDAQFQQIMLQKYFAYFFVDYQAWFEKRRTGYPVLPRGTGIPTGNDFPSRVPYPTYLQSLNPEGLAAAIASIGPDVSDTKVWWEK
jgi:hypothetical protein